MPKVILTRPDYEKVTHYLFVWSKKLIKTAQKYKWQVLNLEKNQANLKKFTDSINKNSPQLVLLHGHGSYRSITGQNEEILLEKGKNENLLEGAHTYAFSCETAKELGPAAVKTGAKSYTGYDEVFVFYHTEGSEENPLNDKLAGQFLEPALEVSSSLLRNESPKTAYRNSQKAFKKEIDSLISSKSKKEYLVRYLLWDKNHQVCLTNK